MASQQQKQGFARLPTTVSPQKYFLDYEVVDLENYRFEGTERVQVTFHDATSVIKCHAVEIYVFDVTLRVEHQVLKCDRISYLNDDQAIEFSFKQQVPAGTKAELCLSFRGTLNNNLCGFYRSEYQSNGEQRMMAVTQFEACDARRAFVCWDEPAVKASYEISIVTDPELVAVSNMPVLQTQLRPRSNAQLRSKTRKSSVMEKVWRFAETPIMSSYLVGMVIGEFDSVSAYTDEGVLVTVYTPLGESGRGKFALHTATNALSFFTKQFGVPYPLRKLDMLAIPDFDCGAMENWGVVTYRQTYLLIDEELSSFTQKLSTAKTVCHELAHQWFGNLVTMEWWTSLWLNEGFARFMEFEAVNAIYPDWNIWENFVQGVTLNTAMTRDALKSSHPIEVPVNHPDEVDQIFDMIAYAKGSSFIRMLYALMGHDNFYTGIHNYLVKFKYSNAYSEELWAALEDASGLKITSMAESWTCQTGFPLVTVSFAQDGSVSLTQERFLADTSTRDENDLESIWDIPLAFISSDDPSLVQRVGIWHAHSTRNGFTLQTPLKADETVCSKIPAPKSADDWILLNPGQSGFYLVNYSEEGWKALQRPVRELTLSKLDRVSLLHSVFSCAKAGLVSVATAFDFARAYVNEPEYICWRELSFMMGFYCNLFSHEEFYPALQKYVRKLFAGVMKRLTWEPSSNESTETGLFRTEVISILAAVEDPDIIEESKRRFHEYMYLKNVDAVSADLRRVVFQLQARHGEESHVALLRARYERSNFVEERLDCLAAIGYSKSTRVKEKSIQWSLENVRGQDIHYVFDSVASDPQGATFAWEYIKAQWDELSKMYDDRVMGRIVPTTVAHFKTEEAAYQVLRFMQSHPHDSYNKSLEEKLERVRTKSKCHELSRHDLARWLDEQIDV